MPAKVDSAAVIGYYVNARMGVMIMRNFWGFYDNGIYRVGCNGAMIYVYGQDRKELGRFKDIPYAYCGAFQP